MTTTLVGPGIDAEINYRRDRVAADYRRAGGRRAARVARQRRADRHSRPAFTARHA